MFIAIIYYPVYDLINFEINLSILIKLFLYTIKNSGKNSKYL